MQWMLSADADKRPTAEELLLDPALCPPEMRWDIEHKKRTELEERVRALQAELEWRRSVMDSAGWRACESILPMVARLESCMLRFFPPVSPLPSDDVPSGSSSSVCSSPPPPH